MEYVCVQSTIVNGEPIRAGKHIEIREGEVSESILKLAFKPVGEAVTASDTVNGLTREQAIIKLRQAGVKCKTSITNDELTKRFNDTFSPEQANA